MKKMLWISQLLLFTILLIVSCTSDEKANQNRKGSQMVTFEDLSIGVYVDSAEAADYISRYKNIHKPGKKLPNDTITHAVWFSRDVFKYIDSMITKVDPTIDGIRIHFGAYDRHGRAKGQANANQISLFFVATREVNGRYHKDDWAFFKKPPKAFHEGIINHGELCPYECWPPQ
jgi:hypothetical protein